MPIPFEDLHVLTDFLMILVLINDPENRRRLVAKFSADGTP